MHTAISFIIVFNNKIIETSIDTLKSFRPIIIIIIIVEYQMFEIQINEIKECNKNQIFVRKAVGDDIKVQSFLSFVNARGREAGSERLRKKSASTLLICTRCEALPVEFADFILIPKSAAEFDSAVDFDR